MAAKNDQSVYSTVFNYRLSLFSGLTLWGTNVYDIFLEIGDAFTEEEFSFYIFYSATRILTK